VGVRIATSFALACLLLLVAATRTEAEPDQPLETPAWSKGWQQPPTPPGTPSWTERAQLVSTPAPPAQPVTAVQQPATPQQYRISKGDKVKISTFGEDRFSGEFLVHGDGKITFPLFGDIPAAGLTTVQLIYDIKSRLAPDYLRDPQVTAEVTGFRPVYILGEVARPGQYPYAEGLTIYALIAQAGGFSYRANHRHAWIRHDDYTAEQRIDIVSSTPVMPGDTVRIDQRIF
jgi:polysaccharide export outer membrane protein